MLCSEKQVRAQLKQLFESQNKPVVYVTHDQTEAMTLSSKVAVLYDGWVQQLDPPSRIYSCPANQFVAGFVGSPQMNLITLPCEGRTALLGNSKLPLPDLSPLPQQILLGIRPEDVQLVEGEDTSAISGRVYLTEELGKENLISVKVDGTEITLRALLSADGFSDRNRVSLILPERRMHWFDPKTGDRIS